MFYLCQCLSVDACVQLIYLMIEMDKSRELSESAQKQQVADLVASYVFSSNFLQHLRHQYKHFLQLREDERKNLIKSAEIFRVREDKSNMLVNFNQSTFCILIYGELRYRQKMYYKGHYFVTGEEKAQVQFRKKTALVMLNRADFQNIMEMYERYYTKKTIFDRILPIETLAVDKRDYKTLIDQATIVSETNKFNEVINQKDRLGLFILFEGVFSISSKSQVKLSQISSDYFGEQSLWGGDYEFILKSESYDFKYMFISRHDLLRHVHSEGIVRFKDLYSRKKALRLEIERKYEQNLEYTRKFLKNSPTRRIKKRFNDEQVEDFNEILGKMAKKVHKSKWKLQQQRIEEDNLRRMREKRIYMPKKAKSKYFSNRQNTCFQFSYHEALHREDPHRDKSFQPKLSLHERAKTEIIFKRSRGEFASPDKGGPSFSSMTVREMTKSHSYGFYSNNYDRTYSKGMTNLSKMKRYDDLKNSITRKRGEKVLSLSEINQALSTSLKRLQQTLRSTSRLNNCDEETQFQRTQRRKRVLVQKLMSSKAFQNTWR